MSRLKVAESASPGQPSLRWNLNADGSACEFSSLSRTPDDGAPLAIRGGMARQPRTYIAGASWHLTQRGVNRSLTFKGSADYRVFLTIMRLESQRTGVRIHAYALMGNHVHLLATPLSDTSFPTLMQGIGRRYVQFFNRCHDRSGALWESRYRTALVHDERYWLTCMRYVELNPVRAGIVADPNEYRWSSYAHHAHGGSDGLITEHPVYLALGASAEARQLAWREICAQETWLPELDYITEGWPTSRRHGTNHPRS
jgi:putative transposase